MKTQNSTKNAWDKLFRLAGQAPSENMEMPFGFATRAVAAWKTAPSESFFAALEGLTWRGLAVAMLIFGGCAAFGYDSLVTTISGDASQAGVFLSDLLGL